MGTAEDMIEEMSLSDGVQDNMKILPSIEEIGRGVRKRISYLANLCDCEILRRTVCDSLLYAALKPDKGGEKTKNIQSICAATDAEEVCQKEIVAMLKLFQDISSLFSDSATSALAQ